MKNPWGPSSAGQGSLERFIANKTAVRTEEEDRSTAFAQRICSNLQVVSCAAPRVSSLPSNQIGALRDKDYWCSRGCSQNTKQHAGGGGREDPREDLLPRKSSSTDHVALVTEVEEAIAAWVSGPQEIQRRRELSSCGEASHHVALRHPKLQQQQTSTSLQEPAAAAAAGRVLSSFHSRRQNNICREGDHQRSAIRPRKPPGYDHYLDDTSTPFQQISPVVRHPDFQSISTSRNHDLIQRFPPLVLSKVSPPKVAQRAGVWRHELYPLPLPPQDFRVSVKAEPDVFFPSTAPVRHIVTHTGTTNERSNPMSPHVQEEQTLYQIAAGPTQRMNFLPTEEVPVVHSEEMMTMMSPGSLPSEDEDSGEGQEELLVRGGLLSQEAINPVQRDVNPNDDSTPTPAAMPHAAVLERSGSPNPRTLDNLVRKISAIRAQTPQIPWESLVTLPNPSSDDGPVVHQGSPLLPPSTARPTVITSAPKTLAFAKSNSNRLHSTLINLPKELMSRGDNLIIPIGEAEYWR